MAISANAADTNPQGRLAALVLQVPMANTFISPGIRAGMSAIIAAMNRLRRSQGLAPRALGRNTNTCDGDPSR